MMPIGVLLDSRFMSLVTMLGCPTFIIHAFAGVTGDIAMLESSRQRLVQCAQIVECTLSVRSANGETTIFGLFGNRVLEYHHGSDLERSADGIGNVVAFDAQWSLFKSQSLGNIIHGRAAGAHIADATHLAALHCLLGIIVGTVQKLSLIPSAGHANAHAPPRNPLSHDSSSSRRAGSMGTITSRGTGEIGANKSARPV